MKISHNELIHQHGFKHLKRLGQCFIFDDNILERIAQASDIKPNENVLEIGPGAGGLTAQLCKLAGKVIAIEKDLRLKPVLEQALSGYDNVEIVFSDILDVDLAQIQQEYFDGNSFSVVGNLPYYITAPIIMMMLESQVDIRSLTFLVQKEVASRIVAPPGSKDYSALSVMIAFSAHAQVCMTLPPGCFIPAPKVHSSLVHLSIRPYPGMEDVKRAELLQVVRAAFSQRRKQLINSLSSGLGIEKEKIHNILVAVDISPTTRAEQLSVEQFAQILQAL